MADQTRTIRVPANISELLNKYSKVLHAMEQSLGREPTNAELASVLGIDEKQIFDLADWHKGLASLDAPVGEDKTSVGDLVADSRIASPAAGVIAEDTRNEVLSVLNTLTPREKQVIVMRFGFDDDEPKTLEEIGASFGVTRERIRQIETKALSKLRNPVRSAMIKKCIV
jgi:RNA polymerase primary sigma factor